MKLPYLILVVLLVLFSGGDMQKIEADPPILKAAVDQMTRQLAGTYWTYPFPGKGAQEKFWFRLNADGTTTAGWHPMAGKWKVVGDWTIKAKILGGEITKDRFGVLRFNAALTQTVDGKCKRITAPTPQMIAKVSTPFVPGESPAAAADSGDLSGFGTSDPNEAVAAAPITSELQTSASDIVKANHNNLVFVTGKDGQGSGFIANVGGANYLVTNAHVAAGISGATFKALDNTVVQGGKPTVAVGEDIFRMEMPAGGTPLEVMDGVDANAGIGDEVVVLGNADGAGVINTITGKIVGIGPNLVEVNAPFVPGNSGSPIIHIKSGKVIGVATYTVTQKYDATTKEKMKAPVVRRFGYRLDSVKTWQPVNWQTFYAQANEMRKIESLTKDLDDFFRDITENNGKVTPSRHTNPVIKNRIDQWLEGKTTRLSAVDEAFANTNFISSLKSVCQSDVTPAVRHMSYDYFQRDLADERETRNEMARAFEEIIKNNH